MLCRVNLPDSPPHFCKFTPTLLGPLFGRSGCFLSWVVELPLWAKLMRHSLQLTVINWRLSACKLRYILCSKIPTQTPHWTKPSHLISRYCTAMHYCLQANAYNQSKASTQPLRTHLDAGENLTTLALAAASTGQTNLLPGSLECILDDISTGLPLLFSTVTIWSLYLLTCFDIHNALAANEFRNDISSSWKISIFKHESFA